MAAAVAWLNTANERLHPNADLGPTVASVEGSLYQLGNATGLSWGSTTPDVYWFKRPIIHLFEFVICHLVVLVTYWLSKNHCHNLSVVKQYAKSSLKASKFDQLLGWCFFWCFISQVILKGMRPNPLVQLCWLFMPCHLITLTWVYVCFNNKKTSADRGFCIFLATLCASCHWGPVGAAAFPDHGDHTWPPYEGYIFDFHHTLLCLMPFYWAIRYQFTPISKQWLLHVFTWATWINIGPYTMISFVAGLNLNYMLAPPGPLQRKVPLLWDTPLYRFFTIAGLILLTILCRTTIGLVGFLGKLIVRIIYNLFFGGPPPSSPSSLLLVEEDDDAQKVSPRTEKAASSGAMRDRSVRSGTPAGSKKKVKKE